MVTIILSITTRILVVGSQCVKRQPHKITGLCLTILWGWCFRYYATFKVRKFESLFYHGDIILNRSNSSVILYLKIYCIRQVLDPRLGNLNETRNTSSPGLFLRISNSVFESINMYLDHKLFLQLFVIGCCLFCSRIGKR